MKWAQKSAVVFMGKSMLWSLLLYVVMMLAFNWDEVSKTLNGQNKITIVNNVQPESQQPDGSPATTPANISTQTGIIHTVITLAKTISGITSRPGR